MVVMLPNQHMSQFYGSLYLKTWCRLSDFGPDGDVKGVWKCPDLFQVPIVGQTAKSKWVQYFVGEFDGSQLRNKNPAEHIFYSQSMAPEYGLEINNLQLTRCNRQFLLAITVLYKNFT